jgi:acylphosphatase
VHSSSATIITSGIWARRSCKVSWLSLVKSISMVMAQCLKISFICDLPKTFLHTNVQKNAKKLGLEGMVQMDNSNIVIVICGFKESIDQFVDLLHKEIMEKCAENIEIEPFIKEKDYRGVFRIIE